MAAKTLNELYQKLLNDVYEDDLQSQQYYLSMIESHRQISTSYLMERGGIFVPNNEYIQHYLGNEAQTYGAGLYEGTWCQWTLFAIFPIMDLMGDVVGLVGWDAQNKYKEVSEGEKGLPMYKVSSKGVFAKEKFFFSDVDLLRRQFESRTIFIVDGVFDSIALNYRGIPAISLLGSLVSPEVLFFLRWYKRVYTLQDNDDTGNSLYYRLKRALPQVSRVFQSKTKDIEELLRGDGLDGPITTQLKNIVSQGSVGRTDDIYLECSHK